jgi:serine/threonine protein phosphatase 1
MGTYAIGDTHGCYDEFLELVGRIEKEDKDSKFILVGDIVDRGPKTVELINWAIENISQDGKYQMVIGNHEEEKIFWWDRNFEYLDYNKRTGHISDFTLDEVAYDVQGDDYDFQVQFSKQGLGGAEIKKAIDFFKTLPYYKDIEVNNKRFIIAHAGIPYSAVDEETNTIKSELTVSDKGFIVWNRGIGGFNTVKDAILIHGHTPTLSNEAYFNYAAYKEYFKNNKVAKIVKDENRYNIDCGITFRQYDEYKDRANLAALRLDDLKEFYLYE